jgi:thiol-disulfide isomerase/thioredoxin
MDCSYQRNGFFPVLIILITLMVICLPGLAEPGDEKADITYGGANAISASDVSKNEIENNQVIIHFFFNPGCGACDKVRPVIDAYQANHSEVTVFYYSLENNTTNIDKFLQFQRAFNITSPHIPILFLGNTTLMGESAIENNLDSTVKEIIKKNSLN